VLASWSLPQRAAQLVIVPVEETSVSEIDPTVGLGIGGIILFGSSAPTNLKGQLELAEAGAPHGIGPLVMSDEEGGEVQRLANLVGSLPWPAAMAQSMSTDQVRQLAQHTAEKMLANGVTMDLAPDLDLASGSGPDALHTDGPRSFSPSASVASAFGLAFVQGLEAGGVIPVVKHFPGEGSASANTDDSSAVTPPIGRLESADLLPFTAAIRDGIPVVMVGNASVPGLTGQPAGLSASVINGLLRQQLGFQGVVMTDSLSAVAITNLGLDVPRASVDALEAGADMVLFNSSDPNTTASQVIDAIVSAVQNGNLPVQQLNGSVARVLALKKVNLCV
jgi:beta-N-acetylhexosaminidase